jgi:hypothetical protein
VARPEANYANASCVLHHDLAALSPLRGGLGRGWNLGTHVCHPSLTLPLEGRGSEWFISGSAKPKQMNNPYSDGRDYEAKELSGALAPVSPSSSALIRKTDWPRTSFFTRAQSASENRTTTGGPLVYPGSLVNWPKKAPASNQRLAACFWPRASIQWTPVHITLSGNRTPQSEPVLAQPAMGLAARLLQRPRSI